MENKSGDKTPKNEKVKRTTKRTTEDKIEIVNRICDLYKTGHYTIESCCNEVGISDRTLKVWTDENSEISDIYKKAKEQHGKHRRDGIREKATNALEKLLESYWVTEEEIEETYDKNKKLTGRKIRYKKRWIQANVTAVIFSLKNTDPANWNETQNIDTGGESQVFKIGDQIIRF